MSSHHVSTVGSLAARALLGLALLLVWPASARASESAGLVEVTQRWLDKALGASVPTTQPPLRMDVSVGALDSRLRLAPCTRVEPYLPVGVRLWGRARLGLRCADGAVRWNVFLPVTIHAWGPAWVTRGGVPAGAVLSEGDAVQQEVDWAQESSVVVAEAADWIGRVAARPLAAGQALRQDMIRPAHVFQAGAQVRLLAHGAGFTIASEGQALAAGIVGQPVRVRVENGKVLTGRVMDARTVALSL